MAEDRRIALAALAVTAVVGVGAPIGTVIATNAHDSDRLRVEQIQVDRAELRGVLDEAARVVYVVRARYREVLRQQPDPTVVSGSFSLSGGDPDFHLERRRIQQTVLESIQDRLDLLGENSNRVAIRLGGRADATMLIAAVLEQATRVFAILKVLGRPASLAAERRRERALERSYDEFIRQAIRFVDAAHKVGRSTTG